MFRALAPRLKRAPRSTPPDALRPFEAFSLRRSHGSGSLSGHWYRQGGPSRGTVLLLHPWTIWGQAYFHRWGRLEALRAAGYQAVTIDLAGFGGSGPPAGFFDRDIEDTLRFLRRETHGRPLHVWGVSAGGYWAHPVLSRQRDIAGALFEDVSPHLLEWSWRVAPLGRPFYWLYCRLLPTAYRFLDLRQHAPALRTRAATYVSGGRDSGIPPHETAQLAGLAGARHCIIPDAVHLASIKTANEEVLSLALSTFDEAERG